MYEWLTARGVPPERIILEEQADNTRENIGYSLALLSERGIDAGDGVAVVSSGYHLCRASMYMPGNMVPVAARMPARYLPLEVNSSSSLTASHFSPAAISRMSFSVFPVRL